MTMPFVQHQDLIPEAIAGDRCFLRELLHPQRFPVALGYSLAYAYVEPYGRTLDHVLEQSEVYYVLTGEGTMFLDDTAHAVTAGSYFYIPPGCRQWLRNDGASRFEFLCIVEPPWSDEGETVLESDVAP